MSVRRDDDLLVSINVTPLVDVMLVLLVVLMVTGSHAISRALELNLPRASTGEAVSTPLRLSIDADGRWRLDAEPTDEEAIRTRLRSEASPDSAAALVAADGSVPHREVTRLLDVLRGEGVTRIAFAVLPPAPPAE